MNLDNTHPVFSFPSIYPEESIKLLRYFRKCQMCISLTRSRCSTMRSRKRNGKDSGRDKVQLLDERVEMSSVTFTSADATYCVVADCQQDDWLPSACSFIQCHTPVSQ
jgi:hypothetical protein